jgi:hypothetical protein
VTVRPPRAIVLVVFETREKLAGEIRDAVASLRALAGGRYACVLEPKQVLFEDEDDERPAAWGLRPFLERHAADLFGIPGTLRTDTPADDVFAEWEDEAFFLAFVNGRVGIVVVCPDPGALQAQAGPLLGALVDRLIRYNPAWRADERGRGLFFSRPRLDTVVIPHPSE